MAESIFLVILSSFLLLNPVSGIGQVAIVSWSISNIPSSGLFNIIFPIAMPNASHESGYYFAQQYAFGTTGIGYTGLQPRPDSDGSSIVHAAFSSFINGSTTDDSNCSNGADWGPGVSCSVEISSSYSHLYELLVENVGGTTWNGTVIDTTTGIQTHIGSYTLPPGTPGIQNSQVGFVEYYPWNAQSSHNCSPPWTSVTFGNPRTITYGVGPGKLNAFEYGDCIGKTDYQNHSTSDGVEFMVGFK